MINIEKTWIYDIEIYPNLFYIGFKSIKDKSVIGFELSPRKNELSKLISFLKNNVEVTIGYNNLSFDYPLLHYLLTEQLSITKLSTLVSNLKSKANELINKQSENPYINVIRNPFFTQIDLMKINRYDKLGISLKALEFALQMDNIQELPFPHDKPLTNDEIEIVTSYCTNDLEATYQLYERNIDRINFRFELKNTYSFDAINKDDVGIGEAIFEEEIHKSQGLTKWDIKNKIDYDSYKQFDFNNIVFDYINFSSSVLEKFKLWFKSQVVTDIKGVFKKLPLSKIESIKDIVYIPKLKTKVLDHLPDLNVVFDNNIFYIGSGGIHQSIENAIIKEDNLHGIIDLDVGSFYPNLAIRNKFYPLQLGEGFCVTYEDLYKRRSLYKKGTALNEAIKLSLNSSYGKSNSQFSYLYAPDYTLKTCVNGQLLLLKLIEMIKEVVNVKVIQSNTDGITLYYKKSDLELILNTCREWEVYTKGLVLEDNYYSKMVILNVNNYIAEYTNGKIKRKGLFEYNPSLEKDHSMSIVPLALENYFIKNIPIEETILKEENINRFFKRVILKDKLHELWEGKMETIEIENSINKRTGLPKTEIKFVKTRRLQKVTRYLVTNNGNTLIKLMPPLAGKTNIRESNIEDGWLCTECNNLNEFDKKKLKKSINYDYYIKECYKIINQIQSV